MQQSESGLIIRRHERCEAAIEARAAVPEENAEQLVFSPSSGLCGSFSVRITDLGEGGLGLRVPAFVPRRGRLRIEVLPGPGVDPELCFKAMVTVQRVHMIERGQAYSLGTSFIGLTEATLKAVRSLISRQAAAVGGP